MSNINAGEVAGLLREYARSAGVTLDAEGKGHFSVRLANGKMGQVVFEGLQLWWALAERRRSRHWEESSRSANVAARACVESGLNRLEEYEKLKREREWIPCSKRMPEELAQVLFFGPGLLVTNGATCKGYCYSDGWHEYPDGGEFEFEDVTHWMPLPEGPR